MEDMVSSIDRIIQFSHQGRIISIEQLSFCHRDLMKSKTCIHMVGNSAKDLSNYSVGLHPSLMGTFTLPLPEVNMISHVRNEPSVMEVSFKKSTFLTLGIYLIYMMRYRLIWLCLYLQQRWHTKKSKKKL